MVLREQIIKKGNKILGILDISNLGNIFQDRTRLIYPMTRKEDSLS